MKRRGSLLKALRIWAQLQQLDVAKSMFTNQSMVSRIESEELIAAEMEWSYVTACGGGQMLQTLIDHLQSLLDRWNISNRLMTA